MHAKEIFISIILMVFVLRIHSQDYTLRFAGAGLSTTVDSVQVVNLTQGNRLTIPGSQALHLNGSLQVDGGSGLGEIRFHPNPMHMYSLMEFESRKPGHTLIALYDASGRKVAEIGEDLPAGLHTFRISGTLGGIYLVRISSNGYTSFGKLVSTNYGNQEATIGYESSVKLPVLAAGLKKADDLAAMSYREGDVLRFTFNSENLQTIMLDIPEESKTLTAIFYPGNDIDNNQYPVIQIGAQVWMGRNLETTRFSDGTAIPLITDPHDWAAMGSSAYCWRNNDSSYGDPYGALYNWYTVNSGMLCPSGWSVPDESDWTRLESYLGGRSVAGGKLKEEMFWHWNSPNDGASNKSGFSMVGGGYRDGQGGAFFEFHRSGYLWSATEETPTDGQWRGFSKDDMSVDLGYSIKTTGMSVRCLLNDELPDPGPGTVSDYEGNIYKTIVIGKQTWMAENLRNTHLANGERIPELKEAFEWISATTPGYSWRNNKEVAFKVPYGALYNGYAMKGTSLCPSGYHVPVEEDFLTLEKYLGGRAVSGGKLKDEGTQHWYDPNTGANNSSGFTMLPGGYRSSEGSAGFYDIGRGGYLWASPYLNVNPGGPWYWGFHFNSGHTEQGKSSLNTGFSVRCVKDSPGMSAPAVLTFPVTDIEARTADAKGSCPGVTVFARGFCWSTEPDPDTTDLHMAIWYNNSEYGNRFTATLTNLLPQTTYYVRAYAVHPAGISYGENKTFTTMTEIGVSDLDGNSYKTVEIGGLTWMAENLRTTRYNDGTSIPLETDGSVWANLTSPAYCWFDNDPDKYKAAYGALYNWYTVNTGKLCPLLWHVAGVADWATLHEYLIDSGHGYQGSGPGIAKSLSATTGWTDSGLAGTPGNDQTSNNTSGFTAQPTGNRSGSKGSFSPMGMAGFWWTTDEFDGTNGWFQRLAYLFSETYTGYLPKYNGFSVRCVKD